MDIFVANKLTTVDKPNSSLTCCAAAPCNISLDDTFIQELRCPRLRAHPKSCQRDSYPQFDPRLCFSLWPL